MPLRQFNGDALWSFDEDQLTRVKVHDLVAGREPARSQSGDLGLDIVNGKADVVHAEFVQIADMWIRQGVRMAIAQQLDFKYRVRVNSGVDAQALRRALDVLERR
jgi:hypothetical protein